MTHKPEVVGFATHHDEPMLFPNRKEAAAYCVDGEEPIALIRLSDYEAMQAENDRLRAKLAELESQRPHWAKGYTRDSVAAQVTVAALSELWELLGVSNQTDAIEKLRGLTDKPAEAVPGCFMKLYDSARGMRFGTDWNMGTAARNHRRPLIEASLECETWLAAPSPSQQSEEAGVSALVEALKAMVDRYAPSYHDCTDDGMPSCEICDARAALAAHRKKGGGYYEIQ